MGTRTKLLLHSLLLGGGKRDRTADLLHAMQALSQLSYTPVVRTSCFPAIHSPGLPPSLCLASGVAPFKRDKEYIPVFKRVASGRAPSPDRTTPAPHPRRVSGPGRTPAPAPGSPVAASSGHARR